MKAFRLATIIIVLISLVLARPACSSGLSLVVTTDSQMVNGGIYGVGDTVRFTGSVNNGSVVQDALVLFEVDTPDGNPCIIRTLTTGQTPPGPWLLQVLNVTPTDNAGKPKYTFAPGDDAGFTVAMRNSGAMYSPVVVTLNLFFSNGLPFNLLTIFSGILAPGQTSIATTWPVNIPVNSVKGQAMVCACMFNDYPKNGGLAYSPGQVASFNITSMYPRSQPISGFNLAVLLSSTPSLPVRLGNYTAYATTIYGYLYTGAQTTFTVKLVGDVTGPKGVPDGKVDMRDIAIFARAFGGHPGSPNWNQAADITGSILFVPDGVVNMKDLAIVAREFGMIAQM